MKHLGEDGYQRVTQRVLDTRRELQAGAARLGLRTFGEPQLSILTYGSPGIDTAGVGACMSMRGWAVGYVSEPAGFHHMLNLTHEPVVGRYLADLQDCIAATPPRGAGGTVDALLTRARRACARSRNHLVPPLQARRRCRPGPEPTLHAADTPSSRLSLTSRRAASTTCTESAGRDGGTARTPPTRRGRARSGKAAASRRSAA
jgi:hypothetical protein